MQIELVYFEGCPHVASTRQRLRDALDGLGMSARWTEWNTEADDVPERVTGYSSPTVLVNGVDVERKAQTAGAGCAVGGGPSREALDAALTAAR